MSIAGLLVGMAEAHQEKQKTLFEREMDRRKTLAQAALDIYHSPTTRPEAKGPALQRALGIMSATDPSKKLPKEYEDLTSLLTVPAQPGMPGTLPGTETPGMALPGPEMPSTPAVPPIPYGRPLGPGEQGPSAPPSLQDMPGVPALPSLPGPAAPAMPSVSLPPPPVPPGLRVSSEYTPGETAGMAAAAAAAKMAAEYPYKEALARVEHPLQIHEIGQWGAYDPNTGKIITPPAGISIPVEQQKWNAAAISVALKEKVSGIDWTRPVAPQLNPTLQPSISQEYKRLSEDDSMKETRDLLNEERRMRINQMRQELGNSGAEAAVYATDYARGNIPFSGIPAKIRGKVLTYMQQNGLAAPFPLSADAERTLAETQPVLGQIQELIQTFEPVKDINRPGYYFPEWAKYKVGIASPIGGTADAIAKLNMNRVVGAARILKGGSRAIQALQMAMEHTPDIWKDSPKLIYEKLKNIEDQLLKIQEAAHTEGKGGVMRVPPTPPPLPAPGAAPVVPAVIEQYSKSRGTYRYSTDGGLTWQPGRAPANR